MASIYWTVILTAATAAASMCGTKMKGRRERHCMPEDSGETRTSNSKGVS